MVLDSKKIIYIILAVFLLAIFSFYLYYQFRFYFQLPELILEVPSGDMVITESHIEIKGRIETGSLLTLNGRPIYSKETGEFGERINLAEGLNLLEFEALNKTGKISKIIRYILVLEAKLNATTTQNYTQ